MLIMTPLSLHITIFSRQNWSSGRLLVPTVVLLHVKLKPVLEKRGMQMGKNKWIAGWVWANAHTSQMLTIDTIYYPNVCTVTKII